MYHVFVLAWLLLNSIHPILPAQNIADNITLQLIDYKLLDYKRDRLALTDYTYNSHVPIELWKDLKPHFLPFHHPIRKKLDRLFHEKSLPPSIL